MIKNVVFYLVKIVGLFSLILLPLIAVGGFRDIMRDYHEKHTADLTPKHHVKFLITITNQTGHPVVIDSISDLDIVKQAYRQNNTPSYFLPNKKTRKFVSLRWISVQNPILNFTAFLKNMSDKSYDRVAFVATFALNSNAKPNTVNIFTQTVEAPFSMWLTKLRSHTICHSNFDSPSLSRLNCQIILTEALNRKDPVPRDSFKSDARTTITEIGNY